MQAIAFAAFGIAFVSAMAWGAFELAAMARIGVLG